MLEVNAADLVIGAAAGKGEKHHYIPVFYLKQWAGPDGRVCEYGRPFKPVKIRHVHPDGTGYERGLYTIPSNDDPRVSEYVEREFLMVTDNAAAAVLQKLRAREDFTWTTETRSAWSRFIASLLVRNPEFVRRVAANVVGFFDPGNTVTEKRYRAMRRPEDAETYAEHIARTGHRPAGRARLRCRRS